jgi:tetratricopeptide (TPR) repeat protein
MESKKCTESQEYLDLINKFLEIDPESSMALEMKVKILARQGKVSQAVSIYRKLKEGAASTEAKQEYQFAIADIQFRKGMYKAAYSSAMAVSGVNKGKALVIAAQCVGQTANSCGASTFDRKCNNLYAVQLLEQSGSASASLIQKYKNACPTADDCFKNNSPKSITLECWGVTVYPCK